MRVGGRRNDRRGNGPPSTDLPGTSCAWRHTNPYRRFARSGGLRGVNTEARDAHSPLRPLLIYPFKIPGSAHGSRGTAQFAFESTTGRSGSRGGNPYPWVSHTHKCPLFACPSSRRTLRITLAPEAVAIRSGEEGGIRKVTRQESSRHAEKQRVMHYTANSARRGTSKTIILVVRQGSDRGLKALPVRTWYQGRGGRAGFW